MATAVNVVILLFIIRATVPGPSTGLLCRLLCSGSAIGERFSGRSNNHNKTR